MLHLDRPICKLASLTLRQVDWTLGLVRLHICGAFNNQGTQVHQPSPTHQDKALEGQPAL